MNQQPITARGCLLCIGEGVKGDTFTNPNKVIGQINHYLYPLTGSGSVSDDEMTLELKKGELTDLKALTSKSIHYQVHQKSTWIAFNSLLSRDMQVQIISKSPEQPYIHETKETIFVAVKGKATINKHVLSHYQTGRLLKNKQAFIKLNKGAIVALITYGSATPS